MIRRRFVVLDRDGTIIVERHYLSDPLQVELIPGVATGLRQLTEMGLGLVVITNQSAVSRGFFDKSCLDLIHKRLCEILSEEGVRLNGIYSCLHIPEDECPCRKPNPGLLRLAAKELNFDPQAGFVIGDNVCDMELGRRVGATTFLVRTGYGAHVVAQTTGTYDYVVDGVWDAVHVIQNILTAEKRSVLNGTRR